MQSISRAVLAIVIAVLSAGCGGGRGGSVPVNAPAAVASGFTVPPSLSLTVPPKPPGFIPPKPSMVRRTNSAHALFFAGEVPLSNGVFYLAIPNGNLFGYYSYLSDPHYIYHFDMGYEYVTDANDGNGGTYMYDFASSHWWYTARQQSVPFPYIYDFSLKTTLYYEPDAKNAGHYTTKPRYFYYFPYHTVVALPPFTDYPLPTPSSGPGAITTGSDGALWFKNFAPSAASTAGAITEYPLPVGNYANAGITAGSDGASGSSPARLSQQ